MVPPLSVQGPCNEFLGEICDLEMMLPTKPAVFEGCIVAGES